MSVCKSPNCDQCPIPPGHHLPSLSLWLKPNAFPYQGQAGTQNPVQPQDSGQLGASGFLALRKTCVSERWRVQSPVGPGQPCRLRVQRSFCSHQTSYLPALKSTLRLNCEKHMDEVSFFELTQLPRTFGLCKRTHILRNSSGYVMPGLQPQSHWGPCVSP